ncbi:MAG: hypothetical protein EZS28_006829 [Streblomastix strix]|uniref:FATC domain-containing protein n=1 Tax=Streblomastix strix TaxID=222440 RepID=A0A5J4WRV9_9EUKA|nr:MAG: hypothetical protein EZS28_006829 [Streblomastix strix]
MQLQRKNKDDIMTMLEAFVLDPLSGYGESMFGQLVSRSSSISGVFGNEANRHDIGAQAKQSISCIERKLIGFKFGGEFMAIKKQVTDLIQKASSCENLSNMYLGWMPFW